MNIYDWINAQVDIIKNSVGLLDEKRENPSGLIVQLWALKKHVDCTIDFLERHKRYR